MRFEFVDKSPDFVICNIQVETTCRVMFLDVPFIFFTTLLTSNTKHNGRYFEYSICVISRYDKLKGYSSHVGSVLFIKAHIN